jgi:hypothetical protein
VEERVPVEGSDSVGEDKGAGADNEDAGAGSLAIDVLDGDDVLLLLLLLYVLPLLVYVEEEIAEVEDVREDKDME